MKLYYGDQKNNYENFKEIFVNRIGIENNSTMETKDILEIFNPYQMIIKKDEQLIKISNKPNGYKLTQDINLIKKPNQVIVEGNISDIELNNEIVSNNILGKNNFFIISNNQNIKIPIEETIQEFLSYYNSHLIYDDEIFNLNNSLEIGLFLMEIGENYVKNYLLKDGYGDGFYIEKHELPHYYYTNNLDSSGYIILGEKVSNGFAMTAFKIKPNIGLYISPYTYHTDSYLIGKYNVLYGKSNNYKTYLFKKNLTTSEKDFNKLEIVDVECK